MNKLGIAGSVILDVVKVISNWPNKGMLVQIEDISKCVGGCVCNTGIDLKTLDSEIEVKAYGKVGNDDYGKYVLNVMKDRGLDVSGIAIKDGGNTAFTDVMTVKETGERTFFCCNGTNGEFSIEDIDINNLDCDIFHLGYLLLLKNLDEFDGEFGTKGAKLLSLIQQKGIKTSIDLVSEESERFAKIIIPALKYCNYTIINEIEGGRVAEISPYDENGKISVDNLKLICEKLMSFGVKDCVVIHCPTLSCSLNNKGEFNVLPSLDLPKNYIVGSVGAGDAFCAGMLYAFLKNMNNVDGMRLASCTAVCNLASVNSIDGAKDLKTTLGLENKFSRKQL